MRDSGDIAYPVIAAVPAKQQGLSGRALVVFLRDYARRAVALSAEKNNLSLSLLEKDSEGRPAPENGVFWSLSHKPVIVAGVAAQRPVGIDIEILRPVRAGLMEKITDASEQRLVGPATDLVFFRCWTAKEAVLKAAGCGLSGLSRCRIHETADDQTMILYFGDRRWRVTHVFHDRCISAAACLDGHMQWQWVLLSASGLPEIVSHAS